MDEGIFEDIEEIAENSAYLKAVEEKGVSLEMLNQLPPFEELRDLEAHLIASGAITFDRIFHEPCGYYNIKTFLIADYAVDRAIFIKDVEAYRSMRFESARQRVAMLLYQRFVAQEDRELYNFAKTSSVFQLIHQQQQQQPSVASQGGSSLPASGSAPGGKVYDGIAGGAAGGGHHHRGHSGSGHVEEHKHSGSFTAAPANPANPRAGARASSAAAGTATGAGAGAGAGGARSRTSTTAAGGAPGSVGDDGDESSLVAASRLEPAPPGTRYEETPSTMLRIGLANNPIGVYGRAVESVKERILRGEAPKNLFDEVALEVMSDLKYDVFPRFCKSEFYRRYIRCKFIETVKVSVRDFSTFRVLGRGGFGAVHACRKSNSGAIYAMKCVNKKLVKVKQALDNILEERNVLTMMNSPFVTNLKYALQDDDSLYIIMDLMLGGDLKFHLINAGKFSEKRTRFYAAQVLLGLEHVHSKSVIYRDMKLENVLLDHFGNCKLSDLGLAVVTTVKIKGYAGTPGYTSPEMIKNRPYGTATDFFSFGVMLYRMLCGSKPFKGKTETDLDKAVIEKKPIFPSDVFSRDAIHLLSGLLQKKPEQRLGCGERGIDEIKEHRFFHSIDWGLLEAGYLDPPFVPNRFDVNAASLRDIGDFDKAKFRNIRLDDRFKLRVQNFGFVSLRALQEELVAVMEKADETRKFEKFSVQDSPKQDAPGQGGSCCTVM